MMNEKFFMCIMNPYPDSSNNFSHIAGGEVVFSALNEADCFMGITGVQAARVRSAEEQDTRY